MPCDPAVAAAPDGDRPAYPRSNPFAADLAPVLVAAMALPLPCLLVLAGQDTYWASGLVWLARGWVEWLCWFGTVLAVAAGIGARLSTGRDGAHGWRSLLSAQAARQDLVAVPAFAPTRRAVTSSALTAREYLSRDGLPDTRGTFDAQGTAHVMARRLGEPMRPVQAMPSHVRALAAVCLLQASRGREAVAESIVLRGLLAKANVDGTSPTSHESVVDAVDRALRLHADVLNAVCSAHAFDATRLVALLLRARVHGILPTAECMWLRDVDRDLYYALASVGRRVTHVEGIAALAHHEAEVLAGTALTVPRLDGAMRGIEAVL